ncbi:MAG: hypothetical protein ABSH38_22930 [Verrucomicrobiota bacterium]|jgi:hypothetical protein
MLMALITPTTTMMREGMIQCATKVHAGYSGELNWGFRNSSSKDFIIQQGEPMFNLTLFLLQDDEVPQVSYGEKTDHKYQNTRGIIGSQRRIPADIPKNRIVSSSFEKLDPKKQLREAGHPFSYIGTELVQLQGKWENCTSVAKEAVWRNNPEILKVLHLKPSPAQALELLPEAAYYGNVKLFQNLLGTIPPEQINDTPRCSSTALEQLVKRCAHRAFCTNRCDGKGDVENVQCVEWLLDTGARWNPPVADLRHTRRNLLRHESRYIVQVLRLLLYTSGAANLESILELCRSSALEAKIAAVDAFLVKEIKELRKTKASVNTSNQDSTTDSAKAPIAGKRLEA